MSNKILGLSAFLLFFPATPLSASENNDEANTNEPVLVITAQRVQSDLAELPNNSSILTDSEIADISHIHINEALARIPGTWISRGNGQEHLTAIRSPVFTGPGSCGEFLTLEDGIPVRGKGFCNVNQLFDLNTEQAGRIEVVRGTNSALYGSDAIHGLINVLTPSPKDGFLDGSLEIGPNDYWRLKRSLKSHGDHYDFLFNVNLAQDGGYKESSGYDQQKVSLRHQVELGRLLVDTVLNASNLDQETAGFLQQGEDAYKNPLFQRTNQFPEAYRDARSVRLHSKITSAPIDNYSWQLTPYWRTNKMEFLMHFLPGQPIEENGHDSFGIRWQGAIEQDDTTWVFGAESELTDAYLRQYQPNPTDSGSAFLDGVLPQGQHYDYQVDAQSIAIYANWNKQLNQDWSLLVGGRFDYLEYDYDNLMLDGNSRDDGTACGFGGCRYTRPGDRRDSFDDFSMTVSLGYQTSNNLFSYLKLDQGFRVPQATELYRLQNGQLVSEVDSQSARSIEVGLRNMPSENFWEVNLFSMTKSDVIFQNSDREIVTGAKTSHKGIEFSIRRKLSEHWKLQSNIAYAQHRYENNVDLRGIGDVQIKGNDIDTAPELLASAQLIWQLPNQMRAELEWVHIDEYYTNPENTRDYEGHDLLNLRFRYQWNQDWSSVVRLTNLTDELYAERADFAFGNDRYFVGEPRSIFFAIEGHID
ncbi:TonB-dependent receptor [Aliikangiella marina]|uniref:TonB-dependent receptor n=1 Tax=Aliikangiella marina TaxID=1712262 RepID=UPI00163DE459|nr:TonB-dependent receptor [Aliikangiella marina]